MRMRIFLGLALIQGSVLLFGGEARANYVDVKRAFGSGQYFTAARIAFNDANRTSSVPEKSMAYAWVTESLVRAGLDQSALYFFIRTLQLQDRAASRKVLELAPLFMDRAGTDFLKKFLIRYTRADEYSPRARSAFHLAMAKDKLGSGDYPGALQSASMVDPSSPLYPLSLQLKGTAELMLDQTREALMDFEACADNAEQRNLIEAGSIEERLKKEQPGALAEKWEALRKDAARDLKARCVANQARVLYETGQFEEADRAYDMIPKASFVWTDTLFEHAWSTFAKEEYNRTLGKLVSYKSPALQFSFNSEVDVLMAQAYLSLCLYTDAGRIIEDFNRRLGSLALDVKKFVEVNAAKDARPYFALGRRALQDKLHTEIVMHRFLNRFVRSPYFQSLSLSQDRVLAEKIAIQRLDAIRPETRTGPAAGFPGFLNAALDWRVRTIQLLGGVFVRNSMIDHHQVLISDLEKMQFMKIDILSHEKEKLMQPETAVASERNRGNRIPVRRDDQLLWSFNGEFWNDEIGDYVFALESECGKGSASETP
jgi:tetratricopeptide (TPR) repeat protein